MARKIYQYHPGVGRLFIANNQVRVQHESGGFLIDTNAQGFRSGHDFVVRRAGERKRVLLFGDSYTAGDGVSNRYRYSDLLSETLEVDMFNYGMSGTGTDQHYLIYREFAKHVECDAAIIAVQVENIRRVAAQFRPFRGDTGQPVLLAKPYFTLGVAGLELHHVPVPEEPITEKMLELESRVDSGGRFPGLRKLVKDLGLQEAVQRLSSYQPVPQYDDSKHVDWLLMRAILAEWVGVLRVPVMLLLLPLYQYVEKTASPVGYQTRFGELAAETGAILHDPLHDLWKHTMKERRAFRFEKDVHFTRAGHEAIAESVAPVLKKLLNEY